MEGSYLNIDPSGLRDEYLADDRIENQTHHYAAALVGGYRFGALGVGVNIGREFIGWATGGLQWNRGDIPLGTVAAVHGWDLRVEALGPRDLGARIRSDLLATRLPPGGW